MSGRPAWGAGRSESDDSDESLPAWKLSGQDHSRPVFDKALLRMVIHLVLIALLNLGFGYILAKWLSRRRRYLERKYQWQQITARVRGCLEQDAARQNLALQLIAPDGPDSFGEFPEAAAGPAEPVDVSEARPVGLANLITRAELVQRLGQWWQADPETAGPVALGLVAVDQLREIAGQFGVETANQILSRLAEIVASSIRATDIVGRSSGYRVLLVFPDSDANRAAIALERVRQTIAATQFLKGAERVSVSVTCSATARVPGDTPEDLLLRVEASLLDGRRCGGNHTFLHDGQFPAPVPPPQITLGSSVCSL